MDTERERRKETDCLAPTLVSASISMLLGSPKVNASEKNSNFAGLATRRKML